MTTKAISIGMYHFSKETTSVSHTPKSAKILALKALARQNLPKVLLVESLVRKGVDEELAETTALICEQEGWVNDRQWVESFIARQKAKKDGPKAIYQKLKQKGLDEELIVHLLQEELSKDEQLLQVQALLKSRYRSKDLNDYKEKQKVIAGLIRKGYSLSLIFESLSSLAD